jgi:hypothetical protein
MVNRLIASAAVFVFGSIVYGLFIIVFTQLFAQKPPEIYECLPLAGVLAVSIYIAFRNSA